MEIENELIILKPVGATCTPIEYTFDESIFPKIESIPISGGFFGFSGFSGFSLSAGCVVAISTSY